MTDVEAGLPISSPSLDRLREILPAHPLTGNHSMIKDSQVQFIGNLVDDSGIAKQIDDWQVEDHPRKGPGGRRRSVSTRTVFVLLLLLGAEHSPLLVDRMATIVQSRLTGESLRSLGLWHVRTREQWYFGIWRSLQRALEVIDPKPGQRKKFPTPEDIIQTIKMREEQESHHKQARIDWVCNQLLEATLRLMPAQVASKWQGDLCVDASVIEAYGKRGGPWGGTHLPCEYDAGWYMRTSKHETTTDRKQAKKSVFGWDMTIAIQTKHDPDSLAEFPLLVAGIGMTVPGTDLIGTSRRILESIATRGHAPGRFTGDRGYLASAAPQDLQIPSRLLGYHLFGDYKSDQLGVKEGYAGSIQVEGALYCPSMPELLINATKDLRAGTIDHKTWRLRIKERGAYMLRPKEKPDSKGSVPMMCPARGPGATVDCPLVENGCAKANDSKAVIFKPPAPEKQDRICTNKTSVTVPIEAAAKYLQATQYGTKEWARIYASDRNTIEGHNGFLKDGAHEAISDGTRRRVRGYSAQYLMIAVLVAVGNLRKIDTFMREVLSPGTVEEKRLRRERKLQTRSRRKARTNRVGAWGDYKAPPPVKSEPT